MDEKDKAIVKEWRERLRKDFLETWDGKCSICGKPVEKEDLFTSGIPDSINGAVVGDYIEVKGHRTCCQNVDRIVVIPNRMRAIVFLNPCKQ